MWPPVFSAMLSDPHFPFTTPLVALDPTGPVYNCDHQVVTDLGHTLAWQDEILYLSLLTA